MTAIAAARHANPGAPIGHHGRDGAVFADPRIELFWTPRVGDRVRVVGADVQSRLILGKPLFPGRVGVVERIPAGYQMAYVRLDPIGRAKARVECLGFRLLEAA